MGMNLEFKDFDRLLKQEELVEEPVSIQTFVQDKRYLGLPPLSDIQLEIVRHSTQIYKKHTLQKLMGEVEGEEWYKKYTDNEVICMLGKGCKSSNAKVYSPDLGYVSIGKLALQARTYDVVTHTGSIENCTPFNKMGRGEIIKITTKKGYSTEVYVKHRMMAAPGSASENKQYWRKGVGGRKLEWCFADELSVGDIVPIKIGWPDVYNPVDLSEDDAWWIGAMIGDGSYSTINGGKSLIFTNNTPEVQNLWEKIILNKGESFSKFFSGYNCPSYRIDSLTTKGSKKYFSKLISDFNLDYSSGDFKKWSDRFMMLTSESSYALLNGLWATDGWLSIQHHNGSFSVSIAIDMVSKDVIKGIHDLLTKLGIVSKFSLHKNASEDGRHNEVYRVQILDLENAKKFIKKIGIIPGKEQVCFDILNLSLATDRISCLDENGWYLDRIESIESIGVDDYYDCNVNNDHSYISDGFIDHNSGKDHCSRISIAYTSYLLHCLRDPLSYYGKATGVYVDLLNLAVNAQQAQRVFFEPLKNLLLSSPYFNEVGFEPRVSEIFFFSRPVRCFSGHSESEGWEGYEVLTVVLDEISAFKTDSELKGDVRSKGSASAIYNMSKLSVMSRFPEVGKVILLSFPRYKGDFIQQRFFSANEKSEPKTWTIKAATWEVNPTINREDLESEYIRNPIEARARFECEPPNMEDAYFRDPDSVRRAFSYHDDPIDDDGHYKPWFNNKDNHVRFIHIDLGLKRDRAALAMSHCAGFTEVKTSMGVENLPVINVDFVHSWEATPGNEINFASVRTMIIDLCRRFDVAKVTFDRWQSIEMVQSLKSQGVNADFHSVKKSDYDTLMTAIYDKRLRGYWNEILVEEELLKLRLFHNNKIDHPSGGSKDLADAVAGSVFSTVENLSIENEIDIEVWYPGEVDEDEQDFGNVRVLDRNEGKFVPAYRKDTIEPEGIGKWMEQI